MEKIMSEKELKEQFDKDLQDMVGDYQAFKRFRKWGTGLFWLVVTISGIIGTILGILLALKKLRSGE